MAASETRAELWGAETRKAVANFPVSGERVPVPVVRWLGRIKGAAARVNADLGLLDGELAQRIAAAADEIAQLRPDAVVTLATRDVRAGLTEQTPPGFVAQWARLDTLGIPVLAVRDNPRFDFSMPDCIQQRGRGALECGVAREAVYRADPPWTQLADVPPNVTFLDIADAVCDPTTCPGEVGNVLVYLDDNHLTATYATSMAPLLEIEVLAALGW